MGRLEITSYERRPGRPTCLIVGCDGFDSCVLLNLILFYTALGFDVLPSTTIGRADLVVLTRYNLPPQAAADLFAPLPLEVPIHIYPYVGVSPDIIARELRGRPVSVFAPSEKLFSRGEQLFQVKVLPPVAVEYWSHEPLSPTYEFVHIGNRKPRAAGEVWPAHDDLVSLLRDERVHLWGGDEWRGVPGIKHFHGSLPVFLVPSIYRATRYALGLMYREQIEVETFSSRFFQAPLSGAALLCEQGVRHVFPGVFPLGLDEIDRKILDIEQGQEQIRGAAIDFWRSRYTDTLAAVHESLRRYPAGESGELPAGSYRFASDALTAIHAGELTTDIVYASESD